MRVKIRDQDRRPELSIGVVVGAALIAWFAWSLWTLDQPIEVKQRSLSQVTSPYQCDDGYRFVAPLDTRSAACPEGDGTVRAWPIWTFQCSKDGAFVVQLRYTLDDQQRPRIKAARPLGGDWQEVHDTITCPLCERALLPDSTFREAAVIAMSARPAS